VAGVPFFNAVFEALGCAVAWHVQEGARITPAQAAARTIVATVTGPARALLMGERTALNCLARASGVATQAAEAVAVARAAGWAGQVAGTRKTTPGFGLVEKYALLVGGASTHRMDLSNMVMLKDNHVWSTGGIAASVRKAQAAAGFSTQVEVECSSLAEALEAAGAGAQIVMLDNMTPSVLRETAAALKAVHPRVVIEASGGIESGSLAAYLSPHVDVVSMGKLTQGYGVLDFSLKIASGKPKAAPLARL
jgi:nicotinate-nucleotide pyrophosphorylase (carboxylating)